MASDIWKMQDAKARFSEVVRRAKAGDPQRVTLHGKAAVVVVDADRFDVRPRPAKTKTLAGFVEASKKYRGATEGIDFERNIPMNIDARNAIFDKGAK
jgi:prevent-host-death family protein